MIIEYHRPSNLDEALILLSRKTPKTIPLGGGSVLSQRCEESCAVVDLQNLNLNLITQRNNQLIFGATTTLNQIIEFNQAPAMLIKALKREKNQNLRNTSTIAGTIIMANGRSIFTGALLALDAQLNVASEKTTISLEEFLKKRAGWNKLILELSVPVDPEISWEAVSRSPMDFPLIYVAVAKWPNGRKRIILGGDCPAPLMIIDEKNEGISNSAIEKIKNACSQLETKWAPTIYYQKTAETLLKRLIG